MPSFLLIATVVAASVIFGLVTLKRLLDYVYNQHAYTLLPFRMPRGGMTLSFFIYLYIASMLTLSVMAMILAFSFLS